MCWAVDVTTGLAALLLAMLRERRFEVRYVSGFVEHYAAKTFALVMDLDEAGAQVKYLIRDRDAKFPALFDRILADAGIETVLAGVRMPRMNSIMERWVQTCRHELLDRTLIWNERHLRHCLQQFESHYNEHCPHQAMGRPHRYARSRHQSPIQTGSPLWISAAPTGSAASSTNTNMPPELDGRNFRQAHRRRSLRPSEEYHVPTDTEWQEFLGHFERRKVSTGICARTYSTPCVHEHACLRCSMHWPDPAQRSRIVDIRDNLIARITEAEREGWLGEVEGLTLSLAGANDKITQIDRRPVNSTTVELGLPTIRNEQN